MGLSPLAELEISERDLKDEGYMSKADDFIAHFSNQPIPFKKAATF